MVSDAQREWFLAASILVYDDLDLDIIIIMGFLKHMILRYLCIKARTLTEINGHYQEYHNNNIEKSKSGCGLAGKVARIARDSLSHRRIS